MPDTRFGFRGRIACAAATLGAVVLAGVSCRAPDPAVEVALTDLEAYWAVDRPAGGTQYIAPAVRFRLSNKGTRAHRSIQATGTFRRKGEREAWSGAFTQVAPVSGKPLQPGDSTIVLLKPEGEGRYSSTIPPEQMLAHPQFKDVWVEVYVRVGSSGWAKLAQADVERRIGTRAAVVSQ